MWTILVSLIIGIIIGLFRFLPDNFMKINLKFQQAGIVLLLFSMGASIGANKEIIYNLKGMGVKAMTFAITTSILSIMAVYITSTRLLKEDKRG